MFQIINRGGKNQEILIKRKILKLKNVKKILTEKSSFEILGQTQPLQKSLAY
jgi:hypothetical protein